VFVHRQGSLKTHAGVVQDAGMGALNIQVVIDCADPAGLAGFWAVALDYIVEPPPPGFESWEQFAEQIALPPQDRDRSLVPEGAGRQDGEEPRTP